MRAVVQRVTNADVKIDGRVNGKIDDGLLVLLGVGNGDTEEDMKYIADKIIKLRIFSDENDKMNLSLERCRRKYAGYIAIYFVRRLLARQTSVFWQCNGACQCK